MRAASRFIALMHGHIIQRQNIETLFYTFLIAVERRRQGMLGGDTSLLLLLPFTSRALISLHAGGFPF